MPSVRVVAVVLLSIGACLFGSAGVRSVRGQGPGSVQGDWPGFMAAVDRLVAVRYFGLVPDAIGEPTAFGKRVLPGADGNTTFLQSALASSEVTWRVLALRAIGRLNEPIDVRTEILFLAASNPAVRREAALAIAGSLENDRAAEHAFWTRTAFVELAARVLAEPDTGAAAAMLHAIGQLGGATNSREVEDVLVRGTLVMSPRPADFFVRQTAALRALEAYIRRNGLGARIAPETRRRLRQLAAPGPGPDDDTGPVLPALQALVHAGDDDLQTILAAATFRCRASRRPRDLATAGRPDCGWEIRQLAFRLIDPEDPQYLTVLREGLTDSSFRVRIAALEAHSRDRTQPKTCVPFLNALADISVSVAIEATKHLVPACIEADQAEARLRTLAGGLGDPAKSIAWHLPMAALEALIRFAPLAVKELANDVGLRHAAWQVRATAARMARDFKDHELAFRLSSDRDPNVRVEALTALAVLNSKDLVRLALEALEPLGDYRPNYHVIAAAAALLRDVRGDSLVLPAVTRVLAGLNGRGHPSDVDESSRHARLALLEVIRQSPDTTEAEINLLRPMLEDPDPVVALAVAEILDPRLTEPVRATPVMRDAELQTAVSPCVDVALDRGRTIGIRLAVDEAPVGVRTFLAHVDRRFYNNLTFHRAYPNAYVQGGSPQESDYAGGRTLIRDEIGPGHVERGTVALVQGGRHAGNMQLLFSLVDSPFLDRTLTILGTVGPCDEKRDPAIDQMLDSLDAVREGDRIVSIRRWVREDD